MDKPKGVVVAIIAVVVLLAIGVLLYLRGFDVPTDSVTVATMLYDPESKELSTKSVILDGSSSYIKQQTGENQSERGLKSYEVEDFQEQLDKLRVRFGLPQAENVCPEQSTDTIDSLSISSGSKTKGIVYFCGGVGVDEATNIIGPYQDLFKLVQNTEL